MPSLNPRIRSIRTLLASSLILALICTTPAFGAVILTARQVPNPFTTLVDDVAVSGGGSLDLSTWKPWNTVNSASIIGPKHITIGSGPVAARYIDAQNFSGPSPVTSTTTYANVLSGDRFGLLFAYKFGGMVVPQGYVSGSPLFGSSIFRNASLTSMGLTPGTYTWTWDTDSGGIAGAGTDSFTLIIEPFTVPAPGAAALLGLAAVRPSRRRSRA